MPPEGRMGLTALDLPEPDGARAARREILAVGRKGNHVPQGSGVPLAFEFDLPRVFRSGHVPHPGPRLSARCKVSAIGREGHVRCVAQVAESVYYTLGSKVPELHSAIQARRGDTAALRVEVDTNATTLLPLEALELARLTIPEIDLLVLVSPKQLLAVRREG